MVIVIQGINLIALAIMGSLMTGMVVLGLKGDGPRQDDLEPPAQEEPADRLNVVPLVSTATPTLASLDAVDNWLSGRPR